MPFSEPTGDDPQRSPWYALASFCLLSGGNAFMMMDFAADTTLAESALDASSSEVEWLYSATLYAMLPLVLPASYYIGESLWATTLVAVLCNILAAWLRYLSVAHGSYAIALVSSIVLGSSAAVIICSFTVMGEAFPPERRSLATAIAVQSNYAGWALGCLLPSVYSDVSTMEEVMLVQAVIISLTLVVFLLASPPATLASCVPRTAPLTAAGGEAAASKGAATPGASGSRQEERAGARLGLGASIVLMVRSPQLLLHGGAYSLLAGVSFATTAVQDDIMTDLGFASTWTNFAFVASGVGAGLLFGAYVTEPEHFAPTLRLLFLLTAAALAGLTLLTLYSSAFDDEYTLFALLVLGMAALGVGSLGFIGMGLRVAVEIGRPVSAEFVGGGVEWFVQAWGATLTEVVSMVTDEVVDVAEEECPSNSTSRRALYGTVDTYCMDPSSALCDEAPLWWAWLPLLLTTCLATALIFLARFPTHTGLGQQLVPVSEVGDADKRRA